MSNHKSNNLVRQVLKEIIADPPTSMRKNSEIQQLKLAEAVSYLERKIERQQTEVKVLSEQLGKQIESKEHLMFLLNEEKEKNCKLTQHLNNSNRTAAESKRKLAKFQQLENKEAKVKQEHQLKLGKYRDMLRKKEEILVKANARADELEKNYAHIAGIESELKQLREKMMQMKLREDQILKENEALKTQIHEQNEQLLIKDETILFSEEHLRRLREEYEEMEAGHYHDQEESRLLQIEMKELLQQQNQQIKDLNQRLKFKEAVEECLQPESSLEKSQICNFTPEKPEWELNLFKNQIKRAIDTHVKDSGEKKGLQSDIFLIFQAVETSFNSILSQVISEIQ